VPGEILVRDENTYWVVTIETVLFITCDTEKTPVTPADAAADIFFERGDVEVADIELSLVIWNVKTDAQFAASCQFPSVALHRGQFNIRICLFTRFSNITVNSRKAHVFCSCVGTGTG
jgi:hypothetical protein